VSVSNNAAVSQGFLLSKNTGTFPLVK
jgi:hypothetical protein